MAGLLEHANCASGLVCLVCSHHMDMPRAAHGEQRLASKHGMQMTYHNEFSLCRFQPLGALTIRFTRSFPIARLTSIVILESIQTHLFHDCLRLPRESNHTLGLYNIMSDQLTSIHSSTHDEPARCRLDAKHILSQLAVATTSTHLPRLGSSTTSITSWSTH